MNMTNPLLPSSSPLPLSSSSSETSIQRRCVRLAMFLLIAVQMGTFVVDGFTASSPLSSSPISSRITTTTTSLTIGKRPGSADDDHIHHHLQHRHPSHHNKNIANPMTDYGSIGSSSSSTNAHHHMTTIQQQASNQRKKTQEDQGLKSMSSSAAMSGVPGTEYMQHPLDRNIQLLQNALENCSPLKKNISYGTKTHLINGLTSLLVLSRFMFMTQRRRTCSMLCSISLLFGFIGLTFDNMVNAAGKYVGCGRKLRLLTKIRLIFHGAGVPLLTIPIIEAAFFQGVLSAQVASKMMLFCTSFSLYELINWLLYDSNQLEVVDNRDSSEHSVRYLAGTLTYTSGKVLQCVLPAAILSLSQVTIGSLLVKKSWAGVWLLTSGLVSLISCAIPKRPDVQLYGETVSVGLLWATAACVF